MPETYQKKIISIQKMTDIETAAMVFVDFFEAAIAQGLQVIAGAIDSIEMYQQTIYEILGTQAPIVYPQIKALVESGEIPLLSSADVDLVWQTYAQIVVEKNIPTKLLQS